MIAKICLIAILGCVLTTASPLKPRYRRETFMEKLGKVRERGVLRANGVYSKATENAIKVADAGLNLAEQTVDTTGDVTSTAVEGAGNFGAGFIDMGTETVKAGGEFGNQVVGGGFRLGTEVTKLGKEVVGASGAVVAGGLKGGFDAGAGVIGLGTQAAKSFGNVGSKVVKNVGEDAAGLASAGSGAMATAEGYVLPALDSGFNVARNMIGSGTNMLALPKDRVAPAATSTPPKSTIKTPPAVVAGGSTATATGSVHLDPFSGLSGGVFGSGLDFSALDE